MGYLIFGFLDILKINVSQITRYFICENKKLRAVHGVLMIRKGSNDSCAPAQWTRFARWDASVRSADGAFRTPHRCG